MTKIVIDNFDNNELVHYSIIIVKGHLDGADGAPDAKSKRVNILHNKTSQLDSNPCVNGRFQFLIELNEGQNLLELNYVGARLDFTVEFASRSSPFTVLPLYILCDDDGRFQAPAREDNSRESALRRITLGTKLLQTAIAETMYAANLGRKTFKLEGPCLMYRSKMRHKEVISMEQSVLWEHLGREIMTSDIGNKERKYVAFISWTRYCVEKFNENCKSHADFLKLTDGYVAIGAGGLALFHSGCLYTWPETFENIMSRLTNSSLIKRAEFFDQSNHRGTEGACFSTTLGAVLHEMGHCFDLGHDAAGIMGSDYNDIYKIFIVNVDNNHVENGIKWSKGALEILRYHKWFNDYVKTDKVHSLKFDRMTQVVHATNGIRVVEIRNGSDEMVLHSWLFNKKILKFYFHIPQAATKTVSQDNVLFVEDNCGNIIKTSASSAG